MVRPVQGIGFPDGWAWWLDLADLEARRALFLKAYAAVPSKLRDEIIALVDERPFNWNSTFIEVNGKTKTGDRILEELVSIGVLKEA